MVRCDWSTKEVAGAGRMRCPHVGVQQLRRHPDVIVKEDRQFVCFLEDEVEGATLVADRLEQVPRPDSCRGPDAQSLRRPPAESVFDDERAAKAVRNAALRQGGQRPLEQLAPIVRGDGYKRLHELLDRVLRRGSPMRLQPFAYWRDERFPLQAVSQPARSRLSPRDVHGKERVHRGREIGRISRMEEHPCVRFLRQRFPEVRQVGDDDRAPEGQGRRERGTADDLSIGQDHAVGCSQQIGESVLSSSRRRNETFDVRFASSSPLSHLFSVGLTPLAWTTRWKLPPSNRAASSATSSPFRGR